MDRDPGRASPHFARCLAAIVSRSLAAYIDPARDEAGVGACVDAELGGAEVAYDGPAARDGTATLDRVSAVDVLGWRALASLTAEQVVALLDKAGIASARMRTPAQFAAHPQLAARDRWREVGSPGGRVRALLPPISVTVPGREAAMGDIPAVGLAHRGDPGRGRTE